MVGRFENSISKFIDKIDLNSITKGQLEMSLGDVLQKEARAEYKSRDFGEKIGYDLIYSGNLGNNPLAFAYGIRVGEFLDDEIVDMFLVGNSSKFMSENYKGNYLSDLSNEVIRRKYDDEREDLTWELEN